MKTLIAVAKHFQIEFNKVIFRFCDEITILAVGELRKLSISLEVSKNQSKYILQVKSAYSATMHIVSFQVWYPQALGWWLSIKLPCSDRFYRGCKTSYS